MRAIHDPDAVLDYRWDWSSWLEEDETITSYSVEVDGITLDSSLNDGKAVTAWLSEGTAGTKAEVTCRITTSQGRTDDRTMYLSIDER